jgi:hypothetical protein
VSLETAGLIGTTSTSSADEDPDLVGTVLLAAHLVSPNRFRGEEARSTCPAYDLVPEILTPLLTVVEVLGGIHGGDGKAVEHRMGLAADHPGKKLARFAPGLIHC